MPLCGIADEGARDLIDQIALHRALGLAGIEVRSAGGQALHELDEAAFEELAARIGAADLRVPVVDTPIGGWSTTVATPFGDELGLLRIYLERARRLGCPYLRIMSYPNDGWPLQEWQAESIRRVASLVAEARKARVTLLHENCHGWASRDAESTLTLLQAIDDDHFGLVFDIGNGLAYDYDGYEFAEAVASAVRHVHVKDGVRVNREVNWLLPGDGEARVLDVLRLLARHGYPGWLSIEPHLAHIPHEALTDSAARLATTYADCARRVRELISAVTE